jgi:hypothetical protein
MGNRGSKFNNFRQTQKLIAHSIDFVSKCGCLNLQAKAFQIDGGAWRSLVARLVWDQKVVSSNLAAPIDEIY